MAIKFSLVPFCLVFFGASIASKPTGFNLQSGEAYISKNEESLLLVESGERAVIDWDSFSIAKDELVHFDQKSGSSAVLNFVVGNEKSSIDGRLSSNGKVFLVNPNGILIGSESAIETAGFVASTLVPYGDLDDSALHFRGEARTEVINEGKIHCSIGDIFLIAKKVENRGSLSAPEGRVGVVSCSEVWIRPNEAPKICIRGDLAVSEEELLENPYALAIRHSGRASGRKVYCTAEEGITEVSGAIAADEMIHILGDAVQLVEEARIDASGDSGGGTILIGGDFQGKNPEVKNALFTQVDPGVVICADALSDGDGGKVILWGNRGMTFSGNISAKGGIEGGDGGFVEVSGERLTFDGLVSTAAPRGKYGTLLLDPSDVVIASTDNAASYSFSSCPNAQLSSSTNTATISGATLSTLLNSCSVIIQTSSTSGTGPNGGAITVSGSISWNETTTLTLTSNTFIKISSTISNTFDDGFTSFQVLSANAGSYMIVSSSISAACTAQNSPYTAIALSANGGVSGTFSGIQLSGGSITTKGFGGVVISGNGLTTTPSTGVTISSAIFTTGGNITITGTASIGHGVRISTNGSVSSSSGGAVTINGTTSLNTGDGILLAGGSVTALGGGSITLAGTGQAVGVALSGGTLLTDTGDVWISGTVSGITSNTEAVLLSTTTNGIRSTSGSITLSGTNSSIGASCVGVQSNTAWNSPTSGTITFINCTGGFGISSHGCQVSGLTASGPVVFFNCQGGGGNTSHGLILTSMTATGSILGSSISSGTGNASLGIQATNSITSGSSISFTNVTSNSTAGAAHGIILTGTLSSTASSGGSITLAATGAPSSTSSNGVLVSAGTITTSSGGIVISGTASGTAGSAGIQMVGSFHITNTGGGPITFSGTSSASGLNAFGVTLAGSWTTNTTGLVTFIDCSGGSGTSSHGVNISSAFSPQGALSFQNCAGGSGTSSNGVNVSATLNATGSITGTTITGGSGSSGVGFANSTLVNSSSYISLTNVAAIATAGNANGFSIIGSVTSTGGSVTLSGTGGASSGASHGISLTAGSISASDSLTLTGTASGGTASSFGINMASTGGIISTAGGMITLSGTSSASGSASHGVNVGATWATNTTGLLNFSNCLGGSGTSSHGVNLSSALSPQGALSFQNCSGGSGTTSRGVNVTATLNATGSITGTTITGGSGSGGIGFANSVLVNSSSYISLTNVVGTSTAGSAHGFSISGSITSTGGSVTLSGTGGASSGASHGINMTAGSISASDSLTLTGTASGGTATSFGINMASTGGVISTAGGMITLSGTSSASGSGSHGVSVGATWATNTTGLLSFSNCTGGSGTSSHGVNLGSALSPQGALSFQTCKGDAGITSNGVNVSATLNATGSITGTAITGGSGSGGIGFANSALVNSSSYISLTNVAAIATTGSAHGFSISGSITSTGGSVTLSGTGGASSGASHGINVTAGSISGTSAIALNGTASGSGTSFGVVLSAPVIASSGASVSVAGTTSASGPGSYGNEFSSTITTAAGSISVVGSSFLASTVTLDTTNGNSSPTGGSITFNSTIDGTQDLTLNGGTGGLVTLSGNIGQTTPLNSLTVSGNTISQGGSVVFSGSVSGYGLRYIDAGAIILNGNITANSGGGQVDLSGAVILNTSITIDTSAGGAGSGSSITFDSPGTIDGTTSCMQSLTLDAGSAGDITIDGIIGATTPIDNFTVIDCNTFTWDGFAPGGICGTITIITSNCVTFAGTYDLGTSVFSATAPCFFITGSFVSSGNPTSSPAISFNATGGDPAGSNPGITLSGSISTVNGDVLLDGTSGTSGSAYGILMPGSITATGSANITLNGSSSVASGINLVNGTITVSTGAIMLTGTASTSGDGVDLNGVLQGTNGGSITVVGNGASVGVDIETAQTPGTSATATPLFVTGTGGSSYGILVGAAISNTNGSGSVTLIGSGTPYDIDLDANITTARGTITIDGTTFLGADTTLDTTNGGLSPTGGSITFDSTIDGTQALTLIAGTGGTITLDGNIGTNVTLGALAVNSASDLAIAASTIDVASFTVASGVPTTLENSLVIDASGLISFGGSIDGADSLTLTSGSNVSLLGNVGSTTPLTSIDVTVPPLGTIIVNGNETVSVGPMSYNGLVSVTSNAQFYDGGSMEMIFSPSSTVAITSSFNVTLTAPNADIEVDGEINLSGTNLSATGYAITLSGTVTSVGGDVSLTSNYGNISVAEIDASGPGTGGDITIAPSNGISGGYPTGLIILNGDILSLGGLGISNGGDITFNAGRSSPSTVATIVSSLAGNSVTIEGSEFIMGANEAMTILGDLQITSTTATLGDLVAEGSILLQQFPTTNLLLHGDETLLSYTGSFYIAPTLHFIAGTTYMHVGTYSPSGDALNAFGLNNLSFGTLLIYQDHILNFDTNQIPIPSKTFPKTVLEAAMYKLAIADAQLSDQLPIYNLPFVPYLLEFDMKKCLEKKKKKQCEERETKGNYGL